MLKYSSRLYSIIVRVETKEINEQNVSFFALLTGFSLYYVKFSEPAISENIIFLSTILLLVSATLLIFVFLNRLKLFFSLALGILLFAVVNLGILLGGIYGLGSSHPDVVEGLNRLSLAVLVIWKITSDMRNLNLRIQPDDGEHGALYNLFYGIFFPFKDFKFLVKTIVFIFVSFYLVMSGLELIQTNVVDPEFLSKTEKIGINLLFIGIQTPMMMSSRASISKTFSNYISNIQKTHAVIAATPGKMSSKYKEIFSLTSISFSEINGNGKHLWVSIIVIILLQAFQTQILAIPWFSPENLTSMLNALSELLGRLF